MRRSRKANPTTALTVIRPVGTQVANLEDLAGKARDYAKNAISPRTQKEYADHWRRYTSWCEQNNLVALPSHPGTLAAYVTWLADGQQGMGKRGTSWPEGHKVASSTLSVILSAIKYYHRVAGESLKETLEKNEALREILNGVRRSVAQTRTVRRVKPITARELRDILDMLRPEVAREARDAALLAVGFGACRRRSEVVTLDYMERSTGRGVLLIEDRGIVVKLMVSKTNQSGAEEEYVIARTHAPRLCTAVENWITLAQVQKGEAVFRGLHAGGNSERPQSGYKGVHWHDKGQAECEKPWVAVQRLPDGKRAHFGYFKTPKEAHKVYCERTGTDPHEASGFRHLLGSRMHSSLVAIIIKTRYANLLRAKIGKRKNLRPEEIDAIAAQIADISGHSMRVGHITSAAEAGVPNHHIRLASGHKTDGMISVYTRITDKIGKSSLKGMGL